MMLLTAMILIMAALQCGSQRRSAPINHIVVLKDCLSQTLHLHRVDQSIEQLWEYKPVDNIFEVIEPGLVMQAESDAKDGTASPRIVLAGISSDVTGTKSIVIVTIDGLADSVAKNIKIKMDNNFQSAHRTVDYKIAAGDF